MVAPGLIKTLRDARVVPVVREPDPEIALLASRELVAAGKDPRFLMPDGVRDIIVESGCYTN